MRADSASRVKPKTAIDSGQTSDGIMTMPDALLPPFEDSRRLTGPNVYVAGTGAALEALPLCVIDDALLAAWRGHLRRAFQVLGWPCGAMLSTVHASGATLAFEAPLDQLYAATEVNEWAWLEALHARGVVDRDVIGLAPACAAPGDPDVAIATLRALAREEACPGVAALRDAAAQRHLPFLFDGDAVTLGSGRHGHTWSADAVPAVDAVPWSRLGAIPAVLVTGSNGKTTTVRLLAAMLRAQGLHVAHSCTDGLYLDGELLEGGDYSGPGGARALLRRDDADAAVLETARGGLLRHGLALTRADVAVVTNVQPDHLGEYGVHDLDALARVKLTVARAIDASGLLVLNADDERVARLGSGTECPQAWFALDDAHVRLRAHRDAGGITCAPLDGRLRLSVGPDTHDLGPISEMPLTLDGSAHHNIANAAAASLAAHALGVPVPMIAATLARFGGSPQDNPGRLQHWRLGGVEAFIDFAHNPDGLRELLAVANRRRGAGRLVVALGHAGDRSDADLAALADAAVAANPDLLVLKDVPDYLRGRVLGEIPDILQKHLRTIGVPGSRILRVADEVAAARAALAWAQSGDVLVLPTLAGGARDIVQRLLAAMLGDGWQCGEPVPDVDPA